MQYEVSVRWFQADETVTGRMPKKKALRMIEGPLLRFPTEA
jgi:hypothetical protein